MQGVDPCLLYTHSMSNELKTIVLSPYQRDELIRGFLLYGG